MSCFIRFICCGGTKNVKQDEIKFEEGNEIVSPRFGGSQIEDNTPKQPGLGAKDEINYLFTGNSHYSTKSDNIRPQSLFQGDTKKNYRETDPRSFNSLPKENDLVVNPDKDEKTKRGSDNPVDLHNISLMSMQVEEGQKGNTASFNFRSEDELTLSLKQIRSDGSPSVAQRRPTAMLKGGVIMQKVDRSRDSLSKGLSTENIFKTNSQPKKEAKREVLNSTPLMKGGAAKQ